MTTADTNEAGKAAGVYDAMGVGGGASVRRGAGDGGARGAQGGGVAGRAGCAGLSR